MASEFCDKCNHTGFVIVDRETMTLKKCECYDAAIARERIEKSGMLRNKTFRNFDAYNEILAKVKLKCQEYTPDRSLMLIGQVGSGKTHLAMAIGNMLLDQNIPVVYFGYRTAVAEMKFNILDREYYNRLISKFLDAKILIIDDLFKGGATEAELKIIYEIVDYRYRHNLQAVLSSEKTLAELLKIDEAIISRIVENAKGSIVEIRGSEYNYRLK